jgi:hypothetical protein
VTAGDDDVERAAPRGARPDVLATEPGDGAEAFAGTSMSGLPHRRHAFDGLHCFHCMLAAATAAATRTKITAAATRPALLGCITVLYLGGANCRETAKRRGLGDAS